MKNIVDTLSAAIRALDSVIPNNIEIVLHDLRNPEFSILEISNSHITGRKKGDSVLSGVRVDKAFSDVMENKQEPISLILDYETRTQNGKVLKSSTVLYRDDIGTPYAALCINVDNSYKDHAIALIQALSNLSNSPLNVREERIQNDISSSDNIEHLMNKIITEAITSKSDINQNDAKKMNLIAIRNMQEKGVFLIKGSVDKVATALGVTRYTVYNYLDELKISTPTTNYSRDNS